MKFHLSTKQQNKQWAYFYMGIAALITGWASWKEQDILYLFALILITLVGWWLFWLDRKI